MPTSALCDDGPRIELPVSLPRPTRPKLDATAAAYRNGDLPDAVLAKVRALPQVQQAKSLHF